MAVAKESDTDAVLRFTIGVVLFIPIAAFFLLKWLFHGIIWLLTVAGENKKPAAGKKPASAVRPKIKSGLIQKKRIESPVVKKDEEPDLPVEDSDDEDDADLWEEDIDDEDDPDLWAEDSDDDSDLWEADNDEKSESTDPSEGPGDRGETQPAELENIAVRKDDPGMATIIGAGKYVFGEDLPLGKYDLRVVSGSGGLTIRYGATEDDETWLYMGKGADEAQEYRNLSLEQGRYFLLEDCLRVEITRSKMLVIDP